MTRITRTLSAAGLLLTAALALAGCGGSSNPPDERPTAAPVEPSAFTPLTDTLERARGVEDVLRDSAAERRRQLEEQE
jgi:hypothetical protein